MSPRTVLFLCTGNSCRSQMAEAFVNAEFSEAWEAFSAGTQPAGFVHSNALTVLAEIGIKHQGHSKNASDFYGSDFDLVVTVCDAAAQDCPVWLGAAPQIHLAFEDPAAFEGDEESTLNKFRQVRDEIVTKIPGLLARYE